MRISILFSVLFLPFAYAQTLKLESFATGFNRPVAIENAGDARLFIVEQGGKIKIINAGGTTNSIDFLNIATIISTGGEKGLLGLAFHPNYSTNGFFFLNYVNLAGNTVVARYTVNATNPNIADASSSTILLTIAQPYDNHKGGTLKFGPDGFLYIGMGDGGGGGDPENRAQNTNELLGKMLRIDVNSGLPYKIPANNPFVEKPGADEIWAVGLRNPWKFSFDKVTGNLWIADVGQDKTEEINVALPAEAGLNYGWRCYEGDLPFNTSGCPSVASLKLPIKSINHATGGCSITGGYVYNGAAFKNLKGLYLFADFCDPKIGMLSSTGALTYSELFTGNNFSTFGEDWNNELYIAALNSGTIFKITDATLEVKDPNQTAFIIYPNPTKSEIIIRKSNQSYPTQVSVFDLNGKLILQQETDNIESNSIKTNNLSTGIYLVSIKSDQGKIFTQRIVFE